MSPTHRCEAVLKIPLDADLPDTLVPCRQGLGRHPAERSLMETSICAILIAASFYTGPQGFLPCYNVVPQAQHRRACNVPTGKDVFKLRL